MTGETAVRHRGERPAVAECLLALLIAGVLSCVSERASGAEGAAAPTVAVEPAAENESGTAGTGETDAARRVPSRTPAKRLPLELFEDPPGKLPVPAASGAVGGGPSAGLRGLEAAPVSSPTGAGGDADSSGLRWVMRPEVRGKPGPAEWTVELRPPDAKPGEEVTLAITLRLDPGWHTYSITQPPGNAATATRLEVRQWAGLEPVDKAFRTLDEFEVYHPPGLEGITQQIHHGTVRWVRRFRVVAEPYGVVGTIAFQVCNDRMCLPVKRLQFRLGTVDEAATRPTPGGAEPNGAKSPAEPGKAADPRLDSLTQRGLLPFLLFAATSGFLALLTPCVFPMVPITVSFFLKQAEREHHRPVLMATVYCVGIMLTFTALGLLMAVLFGATSLNALANNPWLNLLIAGVLIFFGANLLGLFEIRVPSWLLNWSSQHESHGGMAGVLFMALTFTLVSFTCTFAFAGMLLVLAARGEFYWPVLGMLAFSAAFSLPFFFLALFPSWLQKLPKSGGWMNTVKVTMGLVEIGASLKFFSVADLAWNPQPVVFDYALVMIGWSVIAFCAGLYLLGLFRTDHDTPVEGISAVRLGFAILFLSVAGYLFVGLVAPEPPEGRVWESIAAFAPPRLQGGDDPEIGPYIEHEGLRFALDRRAAVRYAQRVGKPLLFDFTGVNCVNCRLMEARMARPEIRQRLQRFVLVQLYTDNIPEVRDPQRVAALLEENKRLQEEWFGDVTLPSYVIVAPDGQKRLATFVGLEKRDGEFAEFLDRGWAAWQRLAQQSPENPRQTAMRP